MTDVKKQKDIFTGANLSNKSEIVKVKGYKTFTVWLSERIDEDESFNYLFTAFTFGYTWRLSIKYKSK